MSDTPRKLHNPKSHAPAVYIPCWLIQVPSNLLSYSAKILYGRLSQWSTTKCTVHRSTDQLSQEIGMNPRSLERIIKELRDVGLIGTYQPEAGRVNHYQFYDHPWMHEPINEHLVYHESYPQPPRNIADTPSAELRIPPRNIAVPKIEEIKENLKSFYEPEQKLNKPLPPQTYTPKTKTDWRQENAKVHEFAQSKDQMANEAKHIAEHEAIKRSPMPDYLKEKIGKLKLGMGGDHDDRAKKDRSLQKHVV